MPTSLSKEHRRLLEKATADAHVMAESACRAALENLAVHEKTFRSHMNDEQKKLRSSLRARGRALGDKRDERSGIQNIRHLTELAAYEHWHRLLFTRFLTENQLLITDEANGSVPVTLEECEELASELGARDGLDLACCFASLTLPGVFRRDDPVLDLPIALNDQVELRKLLAALPPEVFRAADALGWTYQFWQAQRKDEVNKSGKKIGADELSPVTQLFTEDYMVEFLLHNTIGAWWAGKIGPIKAVTEEEARAQATLPARGDIPAISWTYLRLLQDETTKTWLSAAGTFDGWPKAASLIRLLDPCMGSGHFLVFALPLLVRLRMEEEKLNAKAAIVAVLKDNLHGLELDERCTQIAAFNVALTAWKLGGYQALPSLNLACSGLAPSATEAEWVALAGDNSRARNGMSRLHSLFKDAPILGSLINPRAQGGNIFEAEFQEMAPLLEKALEHEAKDDNEHEMAVTAHGLAKAAKILTGQFTLVATNVPYLGISKHPKELLIFVLDRYGVAKYDLATVFLERIREFLEAGGSLAAVTLGEWLYLGPYHAYRTHFLKEFRPLVVARLGWNSFSVPIRANPALVIALGEKKANAEFGLVDGSSSRSVGSNRLTCLAGILDCVSISQVEKNPDSRFIGDADAAISPLSAYADARSGLHAGDLNQFFQCFWEVEEFSSTWESIQTAVNDTSLFAGREQIIRWENEQGTLAALAESVKHLNHAAQNWRAGKPFWGKRGVVVGLMGKAACSLYSGDRYDVNSSAIVPKNEKELAPLWCFCESGEFSEQVRRLDNSLKLAPQTLLKVSFDLSHWQKVAAEKYPNDLPKSHSDDPTQWLFNGYPKGSVQPLHVAVARLLGYRWPRQTGSSFLDCPALGPDGLESFADEDGIVCLPPLNREQPAAARLRKLITAAIGTFDERAIIAAAGLKGSKSKTLEDWLRDEFFEQHAKLFHDRPFIWHIWDGRSDGFHVLVNYHKLDHATLQKLTYSYLGNWIQQQSDDAKADKPGAAARLGAARALQAMLAAILEGEAPLDIFVRWKSLKEQAQGWHPDLNDGIRQNIRPFLLAGDVGKKGAGLFRAVSLKLNDKDRGTEPNRPKKDYPWFWCEEEPGTDPGGGKDFVGNRWNNVYLTLAFKKAAG
jgi:hypothetical protein